MKWRKYYHHMRCARIMQCIKIKNILHHLQPEQTSVSPSMHAMPRALYALLELKDRLSSYQEDLMHVGVYSMGSKTNSNPKPKES